MFFEFGRDRYSYARQWFSVHMEPWSSILEEVRLFLVLVRCPYATSVLAAFRYGNITHPETDWPQIGLLSTVPPDASALLTQAITSAGVSGGNLPG